METRTCNKCGLPHALTAYQTVVTRCANKTYINLDSQCKFCRRKYARDRYRASVAQQDNPAHLADALRRDTPALAQDVTG